MRFPTTNFLNGLLFGAFSIDLSSRVINDGGWSIRTGLLLLCLLGLLAVELAKEPSVKKQG